MGTFITEEILSEGGLTANTISATTISGGTLYGDGSNINGLIPTSRTISTTSPLSGGGDLTTNRTISIQDAAADGTTKGAATFTASDFISSSGLISIDYTNAQSASSTNKGFLTSSDWTTFNNKADASGTTNEIAYFSAGSTINSLTTATYPSLTELSYVKGVTSGLQTQINGKQATLTNGYGITGTPTIAVSLTSTQVFATATTSISTATYADITGCSVSLAAGTWLIIGHVVIAATNTIVQGFVSIRDGANTVVAASALSRPASGTNNLNSPFAVSWSVIVSPAATTTYKLSAARGLTTHTSTYTVYDGTGYNTTNHATDNSDKGTNILAIRIA